jgi:hypothetical protein
LSKGRLFPGAASCFFNSLAKQSGFKATHQTTGVMVLDAAGKLVGSYQGDDPGPAVLEMLKKVI